MAMARVNSVALAIRSITSCVSSTIVVMIVVMAVCPGKDRFLSL